MTNYRTDGLPHALVRDMTASRQYGTTMLNLGLWGGARAEYQSGGLLARIVDIPADGTVKRGVTVEGADETFYAEMDRLKALPALADAVRWARLDGGGAIVLITEDTGDGVGLARPLDPESLLTILELRVVSVVDMTAGQERYADPKLANYGMPTTYKVKFHGDGSQPQDVHESRIIEISGDPTTNGMNAIDAGRIPWAGRGLGAQVVNAVRAYRACMNWAEKLLERKQQPVHTMKGLAQLLMQPGNEGIVRARIDLVDANRNMMTGVAVDADDGYAILNADLSGVKDVIQEAQVRVSAECGLPVTLLFGRSPGGLNATGDSDWALLYELITHLQTRATPALERLVSLIFAQSAPLVDEFQRPDDWSIKWNTLAVLNAQQQAEVDNKNADTEVKRATAIEKLVNLEVVSQDEATTYLREQGAYGLQAAEESGQSGARQYAANT